MNKENLMYVTKDKKDSQLCITNYKVIRENKNYSLLDINIETGRKNQIRVQLAHLHHPITGDKKYGAKTNKINRLALHANRFAFIHPVTKKQFVFETECPFRL